MRRSIALIGSCASFALLTAFGGAATRPPSHAEPLSIANAAFIGVEDPALQSLLARIGATISWHRAGRDVLVTTAGHTVVAFTVGDRRYHVGNVTAQARYAPYLKGAEPFLPLKELLSSLSLAGVRNGRTLSLESLLSSLDVRSLPTGTTVVARAGLPLVPRLVERSASRVAYEFDGVGSTIAGTRNVGAGGVRDVVIRTSGQGATAKTLVTVDLESDASPAPATSDDGRDFSLSVVSRVARVSAPPSALPTGTTVTGVDVIPSADAFTVAIGVDGDATYAWHHLGAPDNRFWIDIGGARLITPSRDDRWAGRITAVRVDQDSPSTVRVALSLGAQQSIDVVPSAAGVRVIVSNEVVADASHSGNGSIGSVVASTVVTPLPPPEPVETALLTPAPYRPTYVPTNPRLIVIDPGHGGDDPGTVHNGVEEKTFTLDIARRLRDLLVARGWQVRLTHDTDTAVDPDAQTDHDELQARDDVANDGGARIFVSVHVNAYSEPGPNGTTSYYSKPDDVPLARDVQNAFSRDAGTQNDGIVKSHLYVTLHARMPAVLIEVAFITNPGDLTRLESPQWRERAAEGLAEGIEAYTRENPLPPTPNQ